MNGLDLYHINDYDAHSLNQKIDKQTNIFFLDKTANIIHWFLFSWLFCLGLSEMSIRFSGCSAPVYVNEPGEGQFTLIKLFV